MNDPSLVLSRGLSTRLPESATTRSGVRFCPTDPVWSYRDQVTNVHLDFTALGISAQLNMALKRVLLWYAEHRSPSYVINLFRRFQYFVQSAKLTGSEITATDLMNYRASLPLDEQWYLSTLASFLTRWHAMGIGGVSEDAFLYLSETRWKGAKKGEAVLTMDPVMGRFTDIEFDAVHSTIEAAFKAEMLTLREYVLATLSLVLGPRPIQLAAMKVCDFSIIPTTQSTAEYILRVPRAKQRGSGARAQFRERPLIPSIGQRVARYAKEVRQQLSGLLEDVDEAPMFPFLENRTECVGFEYHGTSNGIHMDLKQAFEKLLVCSERTGYDMNISPIRFRRTVACRAADEGHSVYVIASLLDHEDTQNAGVYVEASPAILERIDKAVAMRLAPLAQAFSGKLITGQSSASRADDPRSTIADPRFKTPIGSCGEHGFCGALAPVACYTCRAFEPWLDAPHEKVLEFLLSERERLERNADRRIASINDRTILAVAEVVILCQEQLRKGEKHED